MEKKDIIKVLKKHSKFVSDNKYYYAGDEEFESIADELKEKCYPEKFVEWIKDANEVEIIEQNRYNVTINKLFTYWKERVNN